MANNYYTRANDFIPFTKARSGEVDNDLNAVVAGFDFFPTDNLALVSGRAVYAGSAGGTADALTATRPDAQLVNTDGDRVIFKASANNTGAATLNVDALGAIALVRADGSASVLGTLLNNVIYEATYQSDTPHWQLLTSLDVPTVSVLTEVLGTSVSTPEAAAGDYTSNLPFRNLNSVNLASAGFSTSNNFVVNSLVHGGQIRLSGETTAGVLTSMLIADPNGTIDMIGNLGLTAIGAFDPIIRQDNSGKATETANVLWNSEGGVHYAIDNGGFTLKQTDAAPIDGNTWIQCVQDGKVGLFFNGFEKFAVTADGADVTNATVANTLLDVIGSGLNIDGIVGVRGDSGGARFVWDESGLAARITQTSAGGTEEDNWITMVDNSAVTIFHNNTAMMRTVVIGSGGLEVNNTVTGAGFERVLTTSDIAAAAALNDLTDVTLTAPATGGLLYKSAGDWINTDAVVIDPAAAVDLKFNTAVTFSTLAAGAEVLGTLLDLDNSGAATAADLRIRNSEGGALLRADADDFEIWETDSAGADETLLMDFIAGTGVNLLPVGATLRLNALGANSTFVQGSTAVDLADTDNSLNVGGSGAAAHIAFDSNTIQGKGDPTTAADLLLQRLGGDVNLYSGGALKFATTAAGADVTNTVVADTIFDVIGSGANIDSIVGLRGDSGGVRLKWDEGALDARLVQTAAAGTEEESWIEMDDNGEVRIYYDGAAKLTTRSRGIRVVGQALATNIALDGSAFATQVSLFMWNSSGGVELDTVGDVFRARSTGATSIPDDTFFDCTAQGAMRVYHNDVVSFETASDGWLINASATLGIFSGSGTPEGAKAAPVGSLFLRTNGGANTTLYVKESGTGNTGWAAI